MNAPGKGGFISDVGVVIPEKLSKLITKCPKAAKIQTSQKPASALVYKMKDLTDPKKADQPACTELFTNCSQK